VFASASLVGVGGAIVDILNLDFVTPLGVEFHNELQAGQVAARILEFESDGSACRQSVANIIQIVGDQVSGASGGNVYRDLFARCAFVSVFDVVGFIHLRNPFQNNWFVVMSNRLLIEAR
jgi:hypothetical protein